MFIGRIVKYSFLAIAVFLVAGSAFGQADPEMLKDVLGAENLPPAVSAFQVRQYILGRIASPPNPQSSEAWTAEAKRIREHVLRDVVFHGWPSDWVNSPPKFEEVAVIETGNGYKLRKLRYEIVPGFYSAAILYEPDHLEGKVPAILNVNGHVGPEGKAVEYKQKRCINYAKRGIMALNLEWFSFGELGQPENSHWNGAHLDLVGFNELGLFYLEMLRGLDYLYDHPNVDRNRLAVTGLSGGGWQTIILSSLDERVRMAMPVAGFSSFRTRVEVKEHGDLGDVEQAGTDMLDGQDYTHLIAMMAPRPTQLAYNAEDDCCFRAGLVKPLIFDAIVPIYKLYGREDALGWHENRDPGTHNYQQDNREQSYHFFTKVFGLPVADQEIPVGPELKTYDELVVGLPKNNLTILGLARKLASDHQRPPVPSATGERAAWAKSERKELAEVVRYKPVKVDDAQAIAITKHLGVETKSFLFPMSNGLTINGVWLRAIGIGDHAPVTVILNDAGKKAAGREVSDRINRGEQVLALDLLFTGDAWGKDPGADDYTEVLHGTGDRPIGLQAAQLIAASRWALQRSGARNLRLEVTGMRTQVAGLIAAALEPNLFAKVVVHEGISSLGYLLEKPVAFDEAPELFCLDLYKKFDVDRLDVIAAPAEVTTEKVLQIPPPSPGR
ncbi:MAG TPA: acetylxylan esterase [Terriglobia bacterium]|nr:acetylxylan esterase [Terriglobia bacterium]